MLDFLNMLYEGYSMTFVSLTFFVFVFLTGVFYYIFPLRLRWWVLLAASVIFYLTWGPSEMVFIAISSLLVYLAARRMDRIYSDQAEKLKEAGVTAEYKKLRKARDRKRCKRLLLFTSALLFLFLIYTKAGDRILGALATWTRQGSLTLTEVIVPLGVSYYTFSLVGYLADVYWRKESAEKNYFRLLLFAIYFPKILQGPISKHRLLGPQLAEGHRFDYRQICFGVQLAVWGFFKKLVIADRLAIFVNEVFDNYTNYEGLIFVVAALLACIQLYCDFSGCMDIAEGVSEIFGIHMEKNFNHPFFSRSCAEFWRRWHITLGTWFKDYVYMPLAVSPRMIRTSQWFKKHFGVRVGKAVMTIVPTGIVWILTGLWHGTGYNYIAWGLYWGTLIILSAVFAPEIKKLTALLRINTESESWELVQKIRTFLIFASTRLIVLPGHLRTTWDVLKKIAAKFDIWIFTDGSLFNYGVNRNNFAVVTIALLILWKVSRMQEECSVREKIARYNLAVRWLIYYAAFFSVLIFGIYGSGFDNTVFTYMNY